jgi:hypothetical protein
VLSLPIGNDFDAAQVAGEVAERGRDAGAAHA